MSGRIGAYSQAGQILRLLVEADGERVSLFKIMQPRGNRIGQYNARIKELREYLRPQGMDIVNDTETNKGQRHSWYRLVKT